MSGIVPVLKDTNFLIDASYEIIVQLLNAGYRLSNAGPNPSKMPVPAPNAIPVQTGISLALTKCQPYNLGFKKILALWLGMTAFGDYRFGPWSRCLKIGLITIGEHLTNPIRDSWQSNFVLWYSVNVS